MDAKKILMDAAGTETDYDSGLKDGGGKAITIKKLKGKDAGKKKDAYDAAITAW